MTATSLARAFAPSRRTALGGAAALVVLSAALALPASPEAAAGTSQPHPGYTVEHHGKDGKNGGKHHGKNHGKDGGTSSGPAGVFGAGSEWKRNITSAPVAPQSNKIVANLSREVTDNWGGVADFHYDQFGVSFVTAAASTPKTTFTWDNCFGYDYTPPQLYDPSQGAVFVDVPIPANAVPAAGTDGEMSVYSPSTDQLWEFWQAHREADGWHACWGGRIDHVSTNPGYFPNGTGVSASGLAATGGAIGISEVKAGQITHAMSLNVIDPANWSTFSYPAQRSDGSLPVGTPGAVQEGQRLRLDPSINVNKLHLSPIATMVAKAAQKYGFIVVDRGGAVALNAEDGTMAQNATGTDPWDKLLGGMEAYDVLRGFPWKKLQALPVDYGKPSA